MLGDYDYGAGLEKLLHETRVSGDFVRKELINQFQKYIPELDGISYELAVSFSEHPTEYSDMLFIDFKIKDYEVNAYFN